MFFALLGKNVAKSTYARLNTLGIFFMLRTYFYISTVKLKFFTIKRNQRKITANTTPSSPSIQNKQGTLLR